MGAQPVAHARPPADREDPGPARRVPPAIHVDVLVAAEGVYRSLERTTDLPPLRADTRPVPDLAAADQSLIRRPAEKGRPCIARSSGQVARVKLSPRLLAGL